MLRLLTIPLLLGLSFSLHAQFTPEQLNTFHFRNIGPANQGGRITDIEALDGDFTHVWVATGSGGVWYSENAGTSWTPIFDDYSTASIGDIAVDQRNPATIWVGTGEANNRNSTSWGDGVFKSTDGGATFTNMGLRSTHHISRVLVHPEDSDDVCVCATGHLWGYTGQRGLYQTTDGGGSWTKLTNGLPDDGRTGCTDLVRDPQHPDILYAAMYHRRRQPWTFYSGGEAGGIYKSEDGGRSWRQLTNGLPTPTGRIGLAIYQQDPNILMALVEAEASDTLVKPGSGLYRSEDGGESWRYVNTYNNRPFYYSQVRINPRDDQRVYLLTTRFMVSEDGGKTLTNGSKDEEVHGDFHAMWLDPHDPDRYYLGADKGVSLTHDHGRYFTLFDNLPIAQFYRIGLDMRDPYYVYGGLQDNGMYGTASFSRDARGILNDHNWKLHWGDGEYVMVDPTDWRTVYTSAENGSLNRYDPVTQRIEYIAPSRLNTTNFDDIWAALPDDPDALRFNWTSPFRMSPHDPRTLYVAGNYVFRSTDGGQSWTVISPDLSTNDPEKRLTGKSGGVTPDNTGAEIHCAASTLSISPIDPAVIWVGTDDGNVQLTRTGGAAWTSLRDRIPEVPAGIWVSRIEAGHFSAGTAFVTFDGHRSDHFGTWIFRTDDFGRSWRKITNGIPEGEVVRVVREDAVNPWLLFAGTETGLWVSLNQGAHWVRFQSNLPTVSIYDLKIHPRDHDLVVATHGRSLWICDDITPLQQFTPELRTVKAHLFDQRRATLWENVSRGGQRGHFWFAGENPATVENTSSLARARTRNLAAITYMLGPDVTSASLRITDAAGNHAVTVDLPTEPGIHRYYWDLEFEIQPYTDEQKARITALLEEFIPRLDGDYWERALNRLQNAKDARAERRAIERLMPYLGPEYELPTAGPGSYRVTLIVDGEEMTKPLEIRADPLLQE
ncbi:MAG: hypothetical protein KDC54_13200 [Lewinella sp.]|nr:hypothetical protein [Lewinella sp.]